jgi:hypothetical protein
MDRRTAIRTLATATALPVLAPEDATALLDARRLVASTPPTGGPHVPPALTEGELEIVGLVADIILPRTDTPGATDVGVPAFIDLIASEWMHADEARELSEGLARLDATATGRFDLPFASCTAPERLELVRELDAQLPPPGSADDTPEGFYPTLKRLVLVGYFTTEVGAAQTGYRITPGTFGGCVAPGTGR